VRNHLSSIFAKLGIGRRMELAQRVSGWGVHAPPADRAS
jgi:DNA-binding CsgD family transcriptional regulator